MEPFGPPNVGRMAATKDVQGLIEALGYPKDAAVRLDAARALGRIGDARAVVPLMATLKDEYPGIRQAAAEALDKLGWRPDRGQAGAAYWVSREQWDECIAIGPPAVEPLINVLQVESPSIRVAAARALGKIGAPAVEPLTAALKDQGLQRAAIEALGRIGAPAVEPLIAALKDDHWWVRRDAAEALGETRDARAVEPLIDALGDQTVHVRQAAAKALGHIGDARAVEPLMADLMDESYWVREQAALALSLVGDARAVDPLTAALQDQGGVARWAAWALGNIGDARAVEPLAAVLRREDPDVRRAAVDALVQVGAPAVNALMASLRDEHGQARRCAAEALVSLYRSGRLDEQQRQLILAERPTITMRHEDIHASISSRGSHSDTGIGVDFPV